MKSTTYLMRPGQSERAQLTTLESPISVEQSRSKIKTIVLVGAFHRGTHKMVRVAENLGHPWVAYHVCSTNLQEELLLRSQWRMHVPHEKLIIQKTPRPQLVKPVVDFVKAERDRDLGCLVHVITGRFKSKNFITRPFHTRTAYGINEALEKLNRVFVTSIPYWIGEYNES